MQKKCDESHVLLQSDPINFYYSRKSTNISFYFHSVYNVIVKIDWSQQKWFVRNSEELKRMVNTNEVTRACQAQSHQNRCNLNKSSFIEGLSTTTKCLTIKLGKRRLNRFQSYHVNEYWVRRFLFIVSIVSLSFGESLQCRQRKNAIEIEIIELAASLTHSR